MPSYRKHTIIGGKFSRQNGPRQTHIETDEEYQQRVEGIIGFRPDTVSFPHFLSEWNKVQGWTTTDFHLEIAQWLYETGPFCPQGADERRRILSCYRHGGKSYITTAYCAWLLFRDPNFCIVLLSEGTALSVRNAKQIRGVIEAFYWCHHLIPERTDQWEKAKFNVVRSRVLLDASVDSRGILGDLTGCHGSLLLADDVEGSRLGLSDVESAKVQDRVGEFAPIAPRHLYVGTPHRLESLYEKLEASGQDFKVLKRPVWKDEAKRITQQPEFHFEGFPQDAAWVDLQRNSMPEGFFKSQFLLIPSHIAAHSFSDQLLKEFEGEIEIRSPGTKMINNGNPQHYIVDNGKPLAEIVEYARYWDPALARTYRDDNSVFAIVGRTATNKVYVFEAVSLPPVDINHSFVSQCNRIVDLITKYRLLHTTVEVASTGQTLVNELAEACRRKGRTCSIKKMVRTANKEKFIGDNLIELYQSQSLYLHKTNVVQGSRFVEELLRFGQGGKDDHIDAVAGAISLLKIPTSRSGLNRDGAALMRSGQSTLVNKPRWTRK